MNLSFKQQFEPFVLDGSKTHSFREGNRWRVGMKAHVATGVRTKDYKLLFVALVKKVEPAIVLIQNGSLIVEVDRRILSQSDADELLWTDGFRAKEWQARGSVWQAASFEYPSIQQARDFWADRLRKGPIVGQLIHWDYANRTSAEDYKHWLEVAKG